MERDWLLRESLVVAALALVEAYALLTRRPPHRLSPRGALLETNFLAGGTPLSWIPRPIGQC